MQFRANCIVDEKTLHAYTFTRGCSAVQFAGCRTMRINVFQAELRHGGTSKLRLQLYNTAVIGT